MGQGFKSSLIDVGMHFIGYDVLSVRVFGTVESASATS